MVLILANPHEAAKANTHHSHSHVDEALEDEVDDSTDGSTIKIALTIKAVLARRSSSGGLSEQDVFVVHELLRPQVS
jgi:hypothetical protein